MLKKFRLAALLMVAALALAPLAACGDDGGGDSGNNGTNNGDNNGTNNGDNNGTNNGDNNGTNNGDNNGTNNGDNNGTNNGDNNGTNNGDNNGEVCAEDAQSPNHSGDTAAAITLGQTVEANICPEVADFYVLSLTDGQRANVAIAFDGDTADLDMNAYIAGDLENPVANSAGVDSTEEVALVAEGDTDFVIEVFGFQGASTSYTLTSAQGCLQDAECSNGQVCDRVSISCVDYSEPACGADGDLDPNGSDGQATAVSFTDGAASYTGLGLCAADQDYFQVTLTAGQSLTATATPNAGEVFLVALDGAGEVIATFEAGEGSTVMDLPFMPAGDVFVLALFVPTEGGPDALSYDLAFTLDDTGCQDNLDCSVTEGARAFCEAGICASLELDTPSALGGPCDSADDCGEDSDGCFNGAQSGDGFLCTLACEEDSECTALGEGAYCQTDSGACLKACDSDALCPAGLSCLDGRCAPCYSDSDCSEGKICQVGIEGVGGSCGEPVELTCGNDDNEPNNSDGQGTLLDLSSGAASYTGLSMCAADSDLFVVELTEPGTLRIAATYTDEADMDILVVPEGSDTPISVGLSEEADQESTVADLIPAGRYVIRVGLYAGPAELSYDFNVSFIAETCTESADCAGTTVRRLSCVEGACAPLEGNGEVALGGTCDSSDDCVEESAGCFTGEPESPGNFCTAECFEDADCADIPGTTCQASGFSGFCLPPQ